MKYWIELPQNSNWRSKKITRLRAWWAECVGSAILLLTISGSAIAQDPQKLTLYQALDNIAAEESISIIYLPQNVENITVSVTNSKLPLINRLEELLRNTDLVFEIKNNQIFLYRKRRFYGYIEDGDSGERLIAASIYDQKTGKYEISNEYGFFSMTTISDTLYIEVSYLGYEASQQKITIDEMDRPTTIELMQNNTFEEIIISDAIQSIDQRTYIELDKGSDIVLYQNQASSAIGGEPDIFQAIIRQSGINAGTDGVGGIHMRGGRNDQNMIMYDGVPLYNSAHAFGLYSVINNSVVDQMRMHKSGVSGKYSGRLSSIIDIKTKDPSLLQTEAQAQVSTLASQATLSLPIIKEKLALTLSARRSHIDPWIKSLSRSAKERDNNEFYYKTGETNFNFIDFNGKLYGKVSDRGKIFVSFLRSGDTYRDIFEESNGEVFDDLDLAYGWSNTLGTIRYNHILTNRTFMNLQASNYRYRFNEDYLLDSEDYATSLYERILYDYNSGLYSNDIRIDFQSIFDHHTIKYGATYGRKHYDFGNTSNIQVADIIPIPDDEPITVEQLGGYKANNFNVYVSSKINFGSNILMENGIYLNRITSKNKDYVDDASYNNIYGYLHTKFKMGHGFFCGFEVSNAIQAEHLLTTGDSGLPSDIWVPSTNTLAPQKSQQVDVYVSKTLDHFQFSSTLFYKQQENLLSFGNVAVLPSITVFNTDGWEDNIEIGSATGHGIELDATYNYNGIAGRLAYTYNDIDYLFENINLGEKYPFDYSIAHTVAVNASIDLPKNWNLMIDWVYSSGRPYTLFSSIFTYSPLENDLDNSEINQLSGLNEFRLPPSHKLNVALSTNWTWGKVRNDLHLGVQNIYNRKNVLYSYIIESSGRQTQTGFPIIPMIRWRVSI